MTPPDASFTRPVIDAVVTPCAYDGAAIARTAHTSRPTTCFIDFSCGNLSRLMAPILPLYTNKAGALSHAGRFGHPERVALRRLNSRVSGFRIPHPQSAIRTSESHPQAPLHLPPRTQIVAREGPRHAPVDVLVDERRACDRIEVVSVLAGRVDAAVADDRRAAEI